MKNLLKNKLVQSIILWSFLIIAAVGLLVTLAYATNFNNVDDKDAIVTSIMETVMNNYKAGWGSEVATVKENYYNFIDVLNKTNTYLFVSHVVIIVLFAAMCILGNKYRKKYYISNLVGGIVAPLTAIVLSVIGIIKNSNVISAFGDTEEYLLALKAFNNVDISVSTTYQTVMMIILVVEIVIYALVLCYTIVKFLLGSKEDNQVVIEDNTDSTKLSTEEVA